MIQEILDPANYSLSLYAVPPLIVGFLVLFLGINAFVWEKGSQVSRVFLLLTFCGAIWLVSYGIVYTVLDAVLADWWVRLSHVGISFIPTLIFFVTLIITHRIHRYQSYVNLSFITSCVFLGSLWTPGWISGIHLYFWGYYPRYGFLGIPFLVFFFIVCLVSLGILWDEYRKAMTLLTKQRCRLWMIAFGAAYLGSVDYLAAFGIPVYPFGYLPVIIFVAIAAHTIHVYHLADITPAFAAKQILQTMQNAVFVVDLEGKISVANYAACALLGYDHSEILNKSILRIIESPLQIVQAPEQNQQVEMSDKSMLWRDTEVHDHLMTWHKKDGSSIRVSVLAAPLRGQNRVADGIVYVAQDITRRIQAETALKESEEKFRSLAESANDAVISADSKGNIVFWNRGAKNIFGYEENEVVGRPLTVLMPERFHEAHRQGLKRFVGSGHGPLMGKTMELVARRKDGTEFPVELSLSSWKSAKGIFVNGILRDTSERKRIEEERQRFFDLSPDMLCIAGFDGYFKQLNPAWEKTLGWTFQELLGKPYSEFVHPEDRDETLAHAEKISAGQPVGAFENRYQCKDGSYRWLLWNAIPLMDRKLIYAAARDITESKKVREMRLRLASIVDSTNDAIIGTTPDGLIKNWNLAAQSIYGYFPTEIIGRSILVLYPRDLIEEARQMMAVVAEGRSFENFETRRLRKDGNEILVSVTLSPIKDETGKIIGISSISRDITRLKEAEEAVQQKKDVEMKSNFISMVSHELRTPLTAIKMGVDILAGEEADRPYAEQKEWLDMIRRNLDRLTRLIDKVLDFQKIDAREMDYDFKKQDLNALIEDLAKTLKPLTDHKGLQLECRLAENLPELTFDKDRMTEVLMNLLSNAVKFTEKGSVCVSTENRGTHAEISVSDTGVGIKREDIAKLFTFFKQVGSHKKTGGTGLGLAISQKIIEQHGGRIWVESEYGKGSSFVFRLSFSD